MKNVRIALVVLVCAGLSACASPRPTSPDAPPDRTETPGTPAPRTPVTRTVQGFRIQILTTPDKREADEEMAEAMDWYRSLPASKRPPYLGSGSDLSIDARWQQPYYRLRVGTFASRDEAQQALSVVRDAYKDAFLVPEQVTITR